MKQQFKKEVDKSRRSGTGRRKKWRYFDDMEAICRHRDITPTVLLHSSKDDDHAGHSEGKFIYDTESSESGKNVSMWFVFHYGNIGRSVIYFFNSPTLSLTRICILF